MKNSSKLLIILATILVVAGIVLSFVHFSRDTVQIIQSNIFEARMDTALQHASALRYRMDGTLRVLNTAALQMSEHPETEQKALLEQLQRQEGFSRIGLTEEGEGESVTLQGNELQFAVPLQEGGRLLAAYPRSHYVHLLDEASRKSTHDFVADSTGTIIIEPGRESLIGFRTNVLAYYAEVIPAMRGEEKTVAQDVADGRGGSLTYTYGNRYRHVSYVPLGINDWYLFSETDGSHLIDRDGRIPRSILTLVVSLVVLCAMGMALLAWSTLERRRAARGLKERAEVAEALYNAARKSSRTILMDIDMETGRITFNEAFERQLGYQPQDLNVNDFLLEGEGNPLPPEIAQNWRIIAQELKRGVAKPHASVQLPHSNGEYLWYRISLVGIYNRDKNMPVRVLGRLANAGWEEQEEDQRGDRGETDEVTGLLSHAAFMKQAERMLNWEQAGLLLVVDIDGFKSAKSTEDGRYQGDQLLARMAKTLNRVFGKTELMCRLGGDTFAVLMRGDVTPEEAAARAGMLCKRFEENSKQTCSVGIAQAGPDTPNIGVLCRAAEQAMYRAKLEGKHRYVFYEGEKAKTSIPALRSCDAQLTLNRCVLALLTSENDQEGTEETLREILQYYRADGIALMQADRENSTFREVYRMRSSKEQPGENLLLPVSGQSLLYRVLQERKTLSITQMSESAVSDPEELRALKERNVRALYITPMIHRGTVWGLMCIKNPSERVGNTTLLKQISSCLAYVLSSAKKQSEE